MEKALIRKSVNFQGKIRFQKAQNFQRQNKEAKAPLGIFRMGPHRKLLSWRQEEMRIQSFLVGVRREFGLSEVPAKFTMSYPSSEINPWFWRKLKQEKDLNLQKASRKTWAQTWEMIQTMKLLAYSREMRIGNAFFCFYFLSFFYKSN